MQLGAAERTRHPAVTIITHLCVLWFEFRYISVSCECFLHAHFSGSVGSVDLGRNSELHACFDVFCRFCQQSVVNYDSAVNKPSTQRPVLSCIHHFLLSNMLMAA